jgi:hypothetical protein
MMRVLTKFYDKVLLEQELAKSLNKALNEGFTRAFSLDVKNEEVKETLQELSDLLAKHKGKQYKQTPLMDNFNELCTLFG